MFIILSLSSPGWSRSISTCLCLTASLALNLGSTLVLRLKGVLPSSGVVFSASLSLAVALIFACISLAFSRLVISKFARVSRTFTIIFTVILSPAVISPVARNCLSPSSAFAAMSVLSS
ncbi:hypothetical protein H2248_000514 [Termitomyces sp. 'cryptogamus']|nr:hypothetical protein H2248_000514 [Termitomyces sp. 'cryptogamus']